MRDYFKDENHDNFDEEYEDTKCYMYKLKVMEQLGLDGNEGVVFGGDQTED